MTGIMFFESKKVKWSKRYFEFKLSGLYHYKDTKVSEQSCPARVLDSNLLFFSDYQLSQETFMCNWNEFEIYECIVPRKKAPSRYGMGIRLQEKMSKAADLDNYVVYFCVEDEDTMYKWLAAYRQAKVSIDPLLRE